MLRMIVFSDIDGTLIDHETYSFAPAQDALTALKAQGVPLVLASSKTAAEILAFRAEIGFSHCPAIVENGGGLLEPGAGGSVLDDRAVHQRLLNVLNGIDPALRSHYQGFSDWTVEQVASHTGLPPEKASLARRRQFTEPGIWSGDDAQQTQFLDALSAAGVTARRGGRYLTLAFGGSKADLMAKAMERFATPNDRLFSIALGDAPNDIEMIQAADLGVIIANPHGAALPELAGEATGRIIRTELTGPYGWNKAILDALHTRDTTQTRPDDGAT